MDLALSEMQKVLRGSVSDFLKNEWSLTQLRQMEKDETQHPAELYSKMGSLGFLGIMVPESYGGAGGSWLDTVVVHEEYGRVLLRAPCWETAVSSLAILHLGSEEQRLAFLPGICQGKLVIALGQQPAPGGEARAKRGTSGYTVSGTSIFVRYADTADYILVPADIPGEKACILLVSPKSRGVAVNSMKSFDGETVCEVSLQDVDVPGANVLTATAGGTSLSDILASSEVLRCAEMVGGASAAMQLGVDYSKQRVQFGALIGSFQALQHKMSDMWLSTHRARWSIYNWAWRLDSGNPAGTMAHVAEMNAREAYRRSVEDSVQIHGGYGLMTDFDITLYYKRAKVYELEKGASWTHKDAIADAIGL